LLIRRRACDIKGMVARSTPPPPGWPGWRR